MQWDQCRRFYNFLMADNMKKIILSHRYRTLSSVSGGTLEPPPTKTRQGTSSRCFCAWVQTGSLQEAQSRASCLLKAPALGAMRKKQESARDVCHRLLSPLPLYSPALLPGTSLPSI